MKNSTIHTMETEFLTRLPVPDIREETFQYSYKQSHRPPKLQPPKLKPRYDSNCNRDHTAHAISFRSDDDCTVDNLLSSTYNCSSNETYFEQVFTRLEKIGEGSFGEVFKVRSKEDGLQYAIKMSKQLFRSELYRQERLEEVRRYEQFSGHANCLRFYRAWEQDDRLYMQMELCRESLDRYLERKRSVPEEKIWSILLDLLLALKSLHDRNLIHLDIKLDNVLIGYDDSCKLADFGLVIDVDRANRHQATEGDSRYVAPEIMQGNFSKAADIFSLGIAMLELSCYLELPSNGPLWQQLRNAVLPEDFIKTISLDLQNIIKNMMTPDPRERPTVDQLLSHKKLASMLQRRSQWGLVHKVKLTIRKSRRLAWSKLCNLKNIVIKFFTSILSILGMQETPTTDSAIDEEETNLLKTAEKKRPRSQLISSTPTAAISKAKARIDFQFDSDCMELAPEHSTPYHNKNNKFVNSTPVNHNLGGSFRIRNDSIRNSFNDNDGSLLDKSIIAYVDDCDSDSHLSQRKTLDISSLRGKKLFCKSDEDTD
ncbi:Membrane-associated tyrosine- and threonine-specific cdc2-inhibitory kinase [Lucilia cuprina]|uniref:Membrane-associated tyrosine- and threonine-specific cdc2-inhibitory kinase n=1 Tax=Lucilia cuprina TaxID=7375 RepID=A0A0L0C778_LUCCU|nr:Membrane-associated tyrosine- and threonine-specific cdc2-inhibitory kinase [Lucilia cuprina]KNC28102.1 Membrane-associated tyrosine- and threonine-specific cdc2-inhibitory kinase [Lucilia cuprina]